MQWTFSFFSPSGIFSLHTAMHCSSVYVTGQVIVGLLPGERDNSEEKLLWAYGREKEMSSTQAHVLRIAFTTGESKPSSAMNHPAHQHPRRAPNQFARVSEMDADGDR